MILPMTYCDALSKARAGKAVFRQHWHWVYLKWNEQRGFHIEHDDGKIEEWKSDADDREAMDWQVADE